jgi:hypothetical protein
MESAGVRDRTADDVCRLVGCEHSADALEAPESRAAWDADRLAQLRDLAEVPDGEALDTFLEVRFKTGTGRDIARRELERWTAEGASSA